MDSIETRLDKIESKIDRLVEAMADIRVLDQRVTQNGESLSRAFARIEQHDKVLEKLNGSARVVSFIERAFWVIATAGAGYYFYNFGDKL